MNDVIRTADSANRDGLPLQVADRPDAFVAEELEAAGVQAAKDYDGIACVDPRDERPDERRIDIRVI